MGLVLSRHVITLTNYWASRANFLLILSEISLKKTLIVMNKHILMRFSWNWNISICPVGCGWITQWVYLTFLTRLLLTFRRTSGQSYIYSVCFRICTYGFVFIWAKNLIYERFAESASFEWTFEFGLQFSLFLQFFMVVQFCYADPESFRY